MRPLTLLMMALLLSACSVFTLTPQAPPAPGSQAQEITRAQSLTLRKIGTISATVQGSPDDAQRELARKANHAGAAYYLIQLVSETTAPGLWYASATLYAPAGTQ